MAKNKVLIDLRNAKIYSRYKELYDINFLRHEKVLELLSLEFFIGISSLQKIIVNQKKQTVVNQN